MYCHNCGAQIPEGSKFCPECGTRLTSTGDVTRGMHEEAEYENEDYEAVGYEVAESKRNSAQDNVKKKPKRWKRIILLIVVLGILAWLFIPDTSGLYIYSTTTYKSIDTLTKKDQQELEKLFQGRYMLHTDEEYFVVDPLDGLGFTDTSIKEFEEELGKFEFSISGNYAYIEITSSTSKDYIIVAFIKPTLKERIYFISKYYSWT